MRFIDYSVHAVKTWRKKEDIEKGEATTDRKNKKEKEGPSSCACFFRVAEVKAL